MARRCCRPAGCFLICGLLLLVALPMAFMLLVRLQGAAKPPATRPAMLPKPDRLDMLIFWIGVGADGIFVMAMTIMLARQASLELAMISGGTLLAGRHFAGIVAAPLVGMIADRVGVRIPLVAMPALLIARFLMIGLRCFAFGAGAIIVSQGALAALFPARWRISRLRVSCNRWREMRCGEMLAPRSVPSVPDC